MNTSFMIGCSSEGLQPGTVLYSNPQADYQVKTPIRITNENLDILKNATIEVTCKWVAAGSNSLDYIDNRKHTVKLNNGIAKFEDEEEVYDNDPAKVRYKFSLNIVNGYLMIEGYEIYSIPIDEYSDEFGIAIFEVKFISKG